MQMSRFDLSGNKLVDTLKTEAGGTTALDKILQGMASQQLGMLIAFASALTLGVGLILWAAKPGYAPVFDRLSSDDAAKITEILSSDDIPYKIQIKTGQILVPVDQVESIRIKLAASGLPQNTSIGLELLQQKQALGTSQFIETARYQHALETELGRTIGSMRNIDSARIHLALPKQSVFIRDREKASASVMVKLSAGRSLEDGQVAAIVNLVASSIPFLKSSGVTMVDQWGRLLTSDSQSAAAAEAENQFQHARKIEQLYSKRIEELLTPLIGRGRIHAKVTAEIDFSVNEQTSESFAADPGKIRSEQNQEQQDGGKVAGGVPGALANQPPGTGTTDPQQTANINGTESTSTNRQFTRNYELDKTITHTSKAVGGIKKISAAIIIDDKLTVDKKGETVRTPLEAEEIEQLTELARVAIGFNEQRGDSVVVINRSFEPVEQIEAMEPPPLWEQPWAWNMGKQVLAGFAVLFLVLMVIRPAMNNLLPNKKSAKGKPGTEGSPLTTDVMQADQLLSSGNSAGLAPPAQVYGDILHMARAMAAEDPKRVAKVVKDWVDKND